MSRTIRIGTRGSQLALVQTDQVLAALQQKYPEWKLEKVIVHTQGDKILDKPLFHFGGKGIFVTEFEEALLRGQIDLAVHSAKDMPIKLAKGLVIAGALPRADARDVLVLKKGCSPHLVIGTGSLRRQFQIRELYSNIECIPIRGNVPTRLQKIRDGVCNGAVLAAAGLERLGLLKEPDFDYHYFSYDQMVPAGGQGIIAIEGRKEDAITGMAAGIADECAGLELETERRCLQLLNAGCHEAIGVISEVVDKGHQAAGQMEIKLQLIRQKNGIIYRKWDCAAVKDRMELAERLVKQLLTC